MKAKKNKRSVQCGDWWLGWGFGGHDKIGKLNLNDDGTFTWKGSSRGRHGGTWNAGAMLHFRIKENVTVDTEKIGNTRAPVRGLWTFEPGTAGKVWHENFEVIEQKGSVPEQSELMKAVATLLS